MELEVTFVYIHAEMARISCWDQSDDTGYESWRSEVENPTSLSPRHPTILTDSPPQYLIFTNGRERSIWFLWIPKARHEPSSSTVKPEILHTQIYGKAELPGHMSSYFRSNRPSYRRKVNLFRINDHPGQLAFISKQWIFGIINLFFETMNLQRNELLHVFRTNEPPEQ